MPLDIFGHPLSNIRRATVARPPWASQARPLAPRPVHARLREPSIASGGGRLPPILDLLYDSVDGQRDGTAVVFDPTTEACYRIPSAEAGAAHFGTT